MRILVSTPSFLPVIGGAELGIHEIYSRIGRDHEVLIVAPTVLAAPGPTEASADEYATVAYRTEFLNPALRTIKPRVLGRAVGRSTLPYTWAVARIVAQWHPVVVNFHFIRRHVPTLEYLHRRSDLPILLSLVARSDVVMNLDRPRALLARRAIAQADLVVPNSSYYLAGEAVDTPTAVIPYGVDTERFRPADAAAARARLGLPADALLLVTVARLAPVKRVDVLVRVAAELRGRGTRALLVVVGDGPERAGLEALVAELGVGDAVQFAGYVSDDDLPVYLQAADAFVFHSMEETFGVVFAQAMATGLPIVVADTSCVSHVVRPANGVLVAPFDVGGFADAIESMTGNPAARERIGRAGRVRAEAEFDWDGIAARYEEALTGLADGVPPPVT